MYRRTYTAPKVASAATTSAIASGQIDSVCVTITLSMIRRCISGITAVTSAASSEAPIAMTVLRRYRQQ